MMASAMRMEFRQVRVDKQMSRRSRNDVSTRWNSEFRTPTSTLSPPTRGTLVWHTPCAHPHRRCRCRCRCHVVFSPCLVAPHVRRAGEMRTYAYACTCVSVSLT